MPLSLDTRQRAMLLEMGVRVWLPGTDFAPAAPAGLAALRPLSQNPERAASPAASPGRLPTVQRGDGANDLSQIATMDWDALARTAADCQACGLCAGRSHSMLSAQAGRRARWMVVGDPPDEDEDAAGQPFTGEAGLLLANMLKAVGATRGELAPGLEAAYVTKVSKCRPPQGRVPQAAELAQCAAYLQREIALVQPSVILAMGRFANQVLLQEHPQEAALPLGRQRGKVYRYQGVPVVVTYTPQALLRQAADKGKAWADLCLAMDLLQTPT
ncbi:MAG: uracil-DNA glycosylase [Rhodoferax sp.]|nr:uracil-DNA glycosylase [Rhodoferax sp.]